MQRRVCGGWAGVGEVRSLAWADWVCCAVSEERGCALAPDSRLPLGLHALARGLACR